MIDKLGPDHLQLTLLNWDTNIHTVFYLVPKHFRCPN